MTKKLTIMSRSESGWHQDDLVAAAKRLKLEVEVRNISAEKDLKEQAEKLGDIVVWRGSSLDHHSERASLWPLLGDKTIINDTIFRYPFGPYKFFQQTVLKNNSSTAKYAIPTFRAHTLKAVLKHINEGRLLYPFITKPNKGAQGVGVELVTSEADLKALLNKIDPKDNVFQNYIKNSGDWRVIIVGGRPLGAIKRIAKKGSHLNNISQGAVSVKEDDPEILSTIYDLAIKAASLFSLRFCGVDIIQDDKTKAFYILETNTVPQWDGEFGFQSKTGAAVADEVVRLGISLAERTITNSAALVEAYYKHAIAYSPSTALHFASRLWLWNKDKWSRKYLDEIRESYVGVTEEQMKATLSKIVERSSSEVRVNFKKIYRKPYFEKYRVLTTYNSLLFKVILCDSLYGEDIRPYVRELVSDKELVSLFNNLIQDHDAVRVLSTHAINYFYLLKYYFKDKITLSTSVLVDPYELIDLLPGYDQLIESDVLTVQNAVKQKIYLLTHAIIGESQYYQRPVRNRAFKELLKEIEKLLKEHYFDISIDNKCEFLVSAKICNYKSKYESQILGEASRSLSWAGNFLVDVYNSHADDKTHSLRTSEHRSVLYVMASHPFQHTAPKRSRGKLMIKEERSNIGRLTRIRLNDLGINRILARVDTGASLSSIHCTNVQERKGKLHFTVLDESSPVSGGRKVSVERYKKTMIKNPTGGFQERYSVPLIVEIGDSSREINFTLADRSSMLYPVLLGRNFLRGNYLVDIDRQFIAERKNK